MSREDGLEHLHGWCHGTYHPARCLILTMYSKEAGNHCLTLTHLHVLHTTLVVVTVKNVPDVVYGLLQDLRGKPR